MNEQTKETTPMTAGAEPVLTKPNVAVEPKIEVPTEEANVPTLPKTGQPVVPQVVNNQIAVPEIAESKKCPVFQGKNYRITVMTDRLIRFEYNELGVFEDRPTQLAIFRDFKPIEVAIKEDEKYLEITTKYCAITYTKEKNFDSGRLNQGANLKVVIPAEEPKTWYYGNPEVRNYLGSSSSLDEFKEITSKGLYSIDGYATVDDSKGHILLETGQLKQREKDIIDIYLFAYKNDYVLALKDYFTLTGIPPLLPRYALGNWWSKNFEYKDENITYLLKKFKRYEMPVSIFLFDKPWHEKDKAGNPIYKWNNELIPNPSETIKEINELGVKVGLNLDPKMGVLTADPIYQTMATDLGIVDKKDIPLDMNNKSFVSSYLKNVINPLEQTGTDFIWNDFYDKKDTSSLALLQYYLHNDSDKDKNKRAFLMSRNGMIAPHRYSVLYSGRTKVSWDVLKYLPFYNSAASNIGISWWSHDIGGYNGGIENKELYLRYIQLGVFSPIFRFSSDSSKYYKRMPWKWDFETAEIAKNYMQLRHRLIPYLYTEAYNYHTTGKPLIQPLYYRYPKIYDQPLYKNEYFFGTEMLIAPICETENPVMNRVAHRFFLPNGIWYDFKTGKKFPGGKNYTSFYKLEDYPIFCKAGAIIPLANNEDLTDTKAPDAMEIHVFPGKNNTYNLFEDDGVSSHYKDGYFIKTSIDYNYRESNYTLIIRATEGKSGIISKTRDYKIRFRNTKETTDITAYENKERIEVVSYIEDNDFIVEANNISTISQLTINCKGQDIEIDALRVINEDIESILSDLQIETEMKIKIHNILFSDKEIKKKRIELRKLKGKKLEARFVKLFLMLLEHIQDTLNIKSDEDF